MKLRGHSALVTGASRNIGRSIALALAREGASVVVHANQRGKELQAVAEEVRSYGVNSYTFLADLSDPQQARKMVVAAVAQLGAVDILVNNAGIRPTRPTLEVTPEEWRRVLGVNLDAAFYCAQAVLPGMIAQRWGRIINISGSAAFKGQPGRVHNSVAKAGILGLTRTLAAEFAADNVLVNTIVPGWVDTVRDTPRPEAESSLEQVPLKRMAKPEHIAEMCVHLCSEAGDSTTGQSFVINCGQFFL